jgi:hypothetical protein
MLLHALMVLFDTSLFSRYLGAYYTFLIQAHLELVSKLKSSNSSLTAGNSHFQHASTSFHCLEACVTIHEKYNVHLSPWNSLALGTLIIKFIFNICHLHEGLVKTVQHFTQRPRYIYDTSPLTRYVKKVRKPAKATKYS